MSSKQNIINQQLKEELQSSDDNIVLEAIKKCRSLGSAGLIPDLLEKWIGSKGEIEKELTELLYTLKDKSVTEKLIETLDNPRFIPYRANIIAIFWNAGLEPKEFLSTLVRVSIEGQYMEALETLTVIENMDPPFPEEELMDALIQLKEYFSKPGADKDEKYTLMQTITTIIKVHDDNQILD